MKIEHDIVVATTRKTLENGTVINRFTHIVKGAEIGENCMVGQCCFVSGKVKIGNNVRIQNGNSLWDGVELEDDVFIAPSVVFTNHHDPADRFYRKKEDFIYDKTHVKKKATICANSTIVAPCTIGEDSRIAAGSIVLRDVRDYEKVQGIVKKDKIKQ